MTSRTRLWAAQMVAILTVIVAVSSCSKDKLRNIVIPNARPTVTITSAPLDPNQRCEPDRVNSCYSITVNWVGYDPDGRVDHFLFAIDPPTTPNSDTLWQVSRSNEERLLFRSTTAVDDSDPARPLARDFHEFVIKAVDNSGVAGPPVSRAFFSYTQAPTVLLTNPTPGDFSFPVLTSSVRFSWVGEDPDGVFNSKPVKYKFILLNPSSAKNGVSLHPDSVASNPDLLRLLFAPSFAEWDSSTGDTTTFQYTNLPPNQTYLFAVVAFDEAGAYSPTFSLRNNMLRFRVRLASTAGPVITAFNEFFNYRWREGTGYCICVQTEIFIEVPADQRVNFNWTAEATQGADMRYYRWSMDNPDLADETPRTDENRDLTRWSSPSLNLTSISIGPFPGAVYPDPPEEHKLYIEAGDNVGLKSLAIIRFQVVRASWPNNPGSILVVKDTRLQVDALDRNNPPCVGRPLVSWPTQAELDTFLFARGGIQRPGGWQAFPWRCYPAGTYSRPGLFAGYAFDTIGTRNQKRDLTVRLSTLSRYEHVVWIVDGIGATYDRQGDSPNDPSTSLRYMSSASRFNTFAAYIKQGGKAWLMGGGGAFATSHPFNSLSNDQPTITFSSITQLKDLGPGRFMNDITRWQSEFRVASSPGRISRYMGRYRTRNDPDPTHYTNFRSEMPEDMAYRQRNTDSLPPLRRDSQYYITVTSLEFLQIENRILENVSTNPAVTDEQSTLDTLYKAAGAGLNFEVGSDDDINPQRNVVMTYYHGPNVPQGFVFSGFNVWDFRRTSSQAMVDFVLRRIWKLNRTSFVRAPVAQAASRPAYRPDPGSRSESVDRVVRRSLRVRNAPSLPTARD